MAEEQDVSLAAWEERFAAELDRLRCGKDEGGNETPSTIYLETILDYLHEHNPEGLGGGEPMAYRLLWPGNEAV